MLLSIIISAYNIENYIKECMNSCIRQVGIEVSEFEIIIVDDGSTDSTSEIIKNFLFKFPNLKYIYKDNGGLSSARNEGLKYAEGDYIWWIDGDDIIKNDAVSILRNHIAANKVEAVIIDYFEFKTNVENPTVKALQLPAQIFDPERFVVTSQSWMPMMSWLSIFKRDFILQNDLFFSEGIIHEDMDLSVRAFSKCKSAFHVKKALYGYRISRSGSIMDVSKGQTKRSLLAYIKIDQIWHDWFEKNDIDLIYRQTAFAIIAKYILLNPTFKSIQKNYHSIPVNKYRREAWFGNWKSKIKMIFYLLLPLPLFNYLYRLKLSIQS